MSEAPKKVWIGKSHGYWQTESIFELDVAYIRADIVYELVDALKELMHASTDKAESMAEAALKKLEEK